MSLSALIVYYSNHGIRWAEPQSLQQRNAYKLLTGKPKGKGPLGRPMLIWEDNIKMDLKGAVCKSVELSV
jgi:hypothetical protein